MDPWSVWSAARIGSLRIYRPSARPPDSTDYKEGAGGRAEDRGRAPFVVNRNTLGGAFRRIPTSIR